MQYININDSVYNICTKYPKIKDILCNAGFDKIKNTIMFNTIARKITIYKAAEMKGINLNELRKKFNEYDFDFIIDDSSKLEDRNKILKSLIEKLHNGEDIEIIRKEFEEKLIKVSAEEVNNAMHELINNGTSIDEAKRFFYMRTLLLKDAMDNMNDDNNHEALEIFKKENREIENILNNIKISNDISLIQNLYDKICSHYSKKESLFFTALKKYGNDEPSKVMTKVDKDIIDEIKKLIDNNNNNNIEDIENHISDMIFKEENILIPLAVSVLTKEDFDNIKKAV